MNQTALSLPPPRPVYDLGKLRSVYLSPHYQALLEATRLRAGGPPVWRNRKIAEVQDLLALAQVSKRLMITALEVTGDLRIDLFMSVKVPCLPDPAGPLQVSDTARLGIRYAQEAVYQPQPGYAFIQVLGPEHVFHPNIYPDPTKPALCLGPKLPAGIPLRELVLLAYGALCMVNYEMNPASAGGVFDVRACEYFQRNGALLPLSREPFLMSQEGPR